MKTNLVVITGASSGIQAEITVAFSQAVYPPRYLKINF